MENELNEHEIINTLLTSLDEAASIAQKLADLSKVEAPLNVANYVTLENTLRAMRWLSQKTATAKPTSKDELMAQMDKIDQFDKKQELIVNG